MTEPATGSSIPDNLFANIGPTITEEFIPFSRTHTPEPTIEETVSLFDIFSITKPKPEPTPEPETTMTTDIKELNLNKPEPFTGDRLRTNKFIQQCQLYLKINKSAYKDNDRMISFILSLMTKGEAGEWQEQYL